MRRANAWSAHDLAPVLQRARPRDPEAVILKRAGMARSSIDCDRGLVLYNMLSKLNWRLVARHLSDADYVGLIVRSASNSKPAQSTPNPNL